MKPIAIAFTALIRVCTRRKQVPILLAVAALMVALLLSAEPAGAQSWLLTGNLGTVTGTNFVGTKDKQPLTIKVNGRRVMLLGPAIKNVNGDFSPNLIGGDVNNVVKSGVQGATIGGGGGFSGATAVPIQVKSDWGTVGGGFSNTAGGNESTVAGGGNNTASSTGSTVGGGASNTASGLFSTVAGGNGNTASGVSSFAAGSLAKAAHDGAFVWADGIGRNYSSSATNEFDVRATGGFTFVSAVDSKGNPTAGVNLFPGGSAWSMISDRAAKENFAPVDSRELLKQLARVPIQTWNYKAQARSIRHIGPIAQDFRAAFKVGEDERHITTIDADGVALAGIQGLYQMLREKDAQIAAQHDEIQALRTHQAAMATQMEELGVLKARLDSLERRDGLRSASAR